MAKRPYRDDFEQGEFTRDIIDIIPERYDSDEDSYEARSGSRLRAIITIIASVAAIVGIMVVGWKMVGGRHGLTAVSGVPEIKAEDHPIKVRPDDRGGMQVPNQDKLVYKSMEDGEGGSNAAPKAERLLAPPEEPRPPTSAATPSTVPPATVPPAPQAESAPPMPEHPPVLEQKPVSAAAEPKRAVVAQDAPAKLVAPPPPKKIAEAKPAEAKPAEPKAAPMSGDYVVQLGAVRSADAADKEWSRILHANNDLLSALSPDVVKVDLPDKGTFWRVRAGSLSDAAARHLCQQLSARNQGCIVAHK